jgi:uncharacterized protein YeaO (DUF488 family)
VIRNGHMDIRLKRPYIPPAPSDGYRILVDRLCPRGVARVLADLDAWPQSLAPSTELRLVGGRFAGSTRERG